MSDNIQEFNPGRHMVCATRAKPEAPEPLVTAFQQAAVNPGQRAESTMEEEKDMVDSTVIDAFHMMWGTFPEPVRLIHKDRRVLAVNEVAASRGMEVGVHCYSVGSPELHKECGANEALVSNKGQRIDAPDGRIRFWSPVSNCPDIFIHFVVFRNSHQ